MAKSIETAGYPDFGKHDSIVKQRNLQVTGTRFREMALIYLCPAAITPGMSGGAALQSGRLVGMLLKGGEQSIQPCFLAVSEIKDWLSQLDQFPELRTVLD